MPFLNQIYISQMYIFPSTGFQRLAPGLFLDKREVWANCIITWAASANNNVYAHTKSHTKSCQFQRNGLSWQCYPKCQSYSNQNHMSKVCQLCEKRMDDLDSRAFARNKVQPDGEEKAISQFAIDHSSQRRKSNRMHQMHQSVEQNPRQVILGRLAYSGTFNPAERGVVV